MTYQQQLQDPRWLEKREFILRRDGRACRVCGASKKLNVHHIVYSGAAWDAPDGALITLCRDCHESAHRAAGGKPEVLYEWPLTDVGQEMFFGYIVGIRLMETEDGEWVRFAEFDYSERKLFKLPCDERLVERLSALLAGNAITAPAGCGIYNKVWIKKEAEGYSIELP